MVARGQLLVKPEMKSRPAIFSFLLHATLLVLAALLIRMKAPSGFGGEPLRRTDVVLATVDSNQKTEYLTEKTTTEAESSSQSTFESAAMPELPTALTQTQPESSPNTPVDVKQFDAGAMSRATTGTSNDLEAAFSQADLEAIAKEQRAMAGRGSPPAATTTSIFGSGALTGTRFVFLIDRSRSMGADGLGVLPRARKELMAALDTLDEGHKFQVVAYHQNTVMVDRRDMLPVTPENSKLAGDFLDHLAAFGATEHEVGLYSALALQPDVLVMLSDGGFPTLNDGQLGTLLKTVRSGTTIHCVEFGTSDLAPNNSFMERLAFRTSGTYRYVDVKTWRE